MWLQGLLFVITVKETSWLWICHSVRALAVVNTVWSLGLGPFLPGHQNRAVFKNAVIPAGITDDAKKIQKACLQI